MGNPGENASLSHNLNVIKQSELSIVLHVTKSHYPPLPFEKRGYGQRCSVNPFVLSLWFDRLTTFVSSTVRPKLVEGRVNGASLTEQY